jgi:hypothetical protein
MTLVQGFLKRFIAMGDSEEIAGLASRKNYLRCRCMLARIYEISGLKTDSECLFFTHKLRSFALLSWLSRQGFSTPVKNRLRAIR